MLKNRLKNYLVFWRQNVQSFGDFCRRLMPGFFCTIPEDRLFYISNLKINANKASAEVSLNPAHSVYSGHFPDNPVTPGVCQLQMVKELVSEIHGQPYFLSSAKSIKFLNVLTPQQDHLKLELDYIQANYGLKASAVLSAGDKIFLKFSGEFLTQLPDNP